MTQLLINIDQPTITNILSAYISYFRCAEIIQEMYTGTQENPSQQTLYDDIHNGLIIMIKNIATFTQFPDLVNDTSDKDVLPFIFEPDDKTSDETRYFFNLVNYILTSSISMEVKTEVIYEMICNHQQKG